MGDGGQGDSIFANFQAKLLGKGNPAVEDRAEEQMLRVKSSSFGGSQRLWSSRAQVSGSGATWWLSPSRAERRFSSSA